MRTEAKPNTFYKTKDGLWMFNGNKEVTLAKQGTKFVLSKYVSDEKTSIEHYDVMAIARRNAVQFIEQ